MYFYSQYKAIIFQNNMQLLFLNAEQKHQDYYIPTTIIIGGTIHKVTIIQL